VAIVTPHFTNSKIKTMQLFYLLQYDDTIAATTWQHNINDANMYFYEACMDGIVIAASEYNNTII
jgi:hypothetical protein